MSQALRGDIGSSPEVGLFTPVFDRHSLTPEAGTVKLSEIISNSLILVAKQIYDRFFLGSLVYFVYSVNVGIAVIGGT